MRSGMMAALLAVLAALMPAAADQWLPAKTETCLSADKTVRLTVIPRGISSPLAYFDDLVKKSTDATAGQQPGAQAFARGILEMKNATGHWAVLWDKRLDNNVAPVSALIANSGRFVVTFDNWHSMGFGDNAVVIYGPGGAIVRKLALTDILPDYWYKALPRSVSSLHWPGEHRIDELREKLILQVVIPGDEDFNWDKRRYAEIPVDLATGTVEIADTPAWTAALAAARKQADLDAQREAERERWFREPLAAPKNTDEGDWHTYLGEIFWRVDPEWKKDYPATAVLRAPGADDYARSVGWLREHLTDANEWRTKVVMIASPAAPENLVKVLKTIQRDVKAGQLMGVRVYVAVPEDFRDPIFAVLAPSGATPIWIDPDRPVPQRDARLKGETPLDD